MYTGLAWRSASTVDGNGDATARPLLRGTITRGWKDDHQPGGPIGGQPAGELIGSATRYRSTLSASTELTLPLQSTSPILQPPASINPMSRQGSFWTTARPALYRSSFRASAALTAMLQSTFPVPGASHASPARS